jgi:hypothetical protein
VRSCCKRQPAARPWRRRRPACWPAMERAGAAATGAGRACVWLCSGSGRQLKCVSRTAGLIGRRPLRSSSGPSFLPSARLSAAPRRVMDVMDDTRVAFITGAPTAAGAGAIARISRPLSHRHGRCCAHSDGSRHNTPPDARARLLPRIAAGITGQDGTYLTEYLLAKNYTVHGASLQQLFTASCRLRPGCRSGLRHSLTSAALAPRPDTAHEQQQPQPGAPGAGAGCHPGRR